MHVPSASEPRHGDRQRLLLWVPMTGRDVPAEQLSRVARVAYALLPKPLSLTDLAGAIARARGEPATTG